MTDLLGELQRRDIKLWREGGQLRFSAPAGALTPELRAEMAARKAELLAQLPTAPGTPAVVPRASRTRPLPLSFAQERLWVLDQLEPDGTSYNVAHCWRITGPFDPVALERSLQEIERRHEVLRTTFSITEAGTPVQTIHPFAPRPLPMMSVAPGDLTRIAEEDAARPFDLIAGPLWRAALARLGEKDHALFLTWHHIICDAWSDAIFARELTALYAAFQEGEPSPLADLQLQFGDFALWQRGSLGEAAMASQLAFWRERLQGDRAPLPLPADRPRPARQSHRGAIRTRDLSSELAAKARLLAREENVTLFILTLAAFQALLARYCGAADICVGSPIAQRPSVETEGLIGFFLNMLALRSDLSGDPGFRELLQRVRATTLDAFQHQDVPFERIVEELQPLRDLSHHPLFQAAFVLHPAGETAPAFPGATVTPVTLPVTTAKFDLTLFLEETREGLRATMEYSTDQFEAATVDRMLASFELLLGGVVADPATPLSRLPILGEAERHRILADWSGSERPYPAGQTIAARFAECAAQTPAAIAVVDGGERLTYAELDARANRLAHFLQSRGVRAGDFVGLHAERSLAFVVKLLGIAKAGAAYVPLDEKEPAERLATMKAACAFVIDAEPDAEIPGGPVVSAARADGPAYVLFTSGSTGVPKGVIVPHCGITRLVVNNDYAPFQPDDVVAFASNACFDAATFEIWGALLNGAKLVVVPQDVLLATNDFGAFLARHGVTTLFLTTALFNEIAVQNPAALRPLKHVLFGGEACNPDCVRRVLDQGAPQRLVHVYGPTETTTFASWHLVREVPADGGTVPIGQAIANTTIYLLDSQLEPLPPGVVGEIFIGGPGVALGYLNDPELTAARFLETQFGRLYRTGDLARRRADGAIEFCGRLDSQLKLRGFRIEPGEVEAAMRRAQGIRECAALVREVAPGDRRLVAYFTGSSENSPSPSELRDQVRSAVPAYMMPSAFIRVERFPLTPNGKLDTRALPLPGNSDAPREGYAAPTNTLHAQLIEIWEKLLHRHPIGIRDDFFDLGGHSLLAAAMLGEVHARLGRRIALATLFQEATIEHVAGKMLGEQQREALEQPFVSIHPQGERRPFFFLHGDFVGGGFFCQNLAKEIGPSRPFYAVHPHGLLGDEPPRSIAEMAADRLKSIVAIQPSGPYLLGGYCNGALVAHEIALLLEARGERVSTVIMLAADGSNYRHHRLWKAAQLLSKIFGEDAAAARRRFSAWSRRVDFFKGAARHHLKVAFESSPADQPSKARRLARTLTNALRRLVASPPSHPVHEEGANVGNVFQEAVESHVPGPYGGEVVLIWPKDEPARVNGDPSYGWRSLCPRTRLVCVPGTHHGSIGSAHSLKIIGEEMRRTLDAADPSPAPSEPAVLAH